MMKTVSLLLLAAGMLLGPAYWIYAKFFSGSPAALVSLTLLMHPEHGKDMLPGMGINNSDFPVKINPVHTVIK